MLARGPADLVEQVWPERGRERGCDVGEVLVGEHAADHREAVRVVAEVAGQVDYGSAALRGRLDGRIGWERLRPRRRAGRPRRLPAVDRLLHALERVLALLGRVADDDDAGD